MLPVIALGIFGFVRNQSISTSGVLAGAIISGYLLPLLWKNWFGSRLRRSVLFSILSAVAAIFAGVFMGWDEPLIWFYSVFAVWYGSDAVQEVRNSTTG
jgi:hypothetical protein